MVAFYSHAQGVDWDKKSSLASDQLATQPVDSQGTILAASLIVHAAKESHISGSLLRVVKSTAKTGGYRGKLK